MKRFLAIFLALALCLSLAACDAVPRETSPSVSVADSTQPSESSSTEAQESSMKESNPEESTEPSPQEPELYTIGETSVQAYRDDIGTVWIMYAVQVTNISDKNLVLGSGEITLSSADSPELILQGEVPVYPEILAPGETAYYCNVIEDDVGLPSELTVSEAKLEVSPTEEAPVRYDLAFTVLKDSLYGGLELSTTVKNNTAEDGELVAVFGALVGKNGEFLGFISGFLDEPLPAGQEQSVTLESFMLPPELTVAQVAEVVTFAYPV